MNKAALPESAIENSRKEIRQYVVGFGLALLLTCAAFGLVVFGWLPPVWTIATVSLLALIQIVVHFHFFLHINLKKSSRDDLQLILFTGLIILLMVGGSLWILGDLYTRM